MWESTQSQYYERPSTLAIIYLHTKWGSESIFQLIWHTIGWLEAVFTQKNLDLFTYRQQGHNFAHLIFPIFCRIFNPPCSSNNDRSTDHEIMAGIYSYNSKHTAVARNNANLSEWTEFSFMSFSRYPRASKAILSKKYIPLSMEWNLTSFIHFS